MDEHVDRTKTDPTEPGVSREAVTRPASHRTAWGSLLVLILIGAATGWFWWSRPATAPAGRPGLVRGGQAAAQRVGVAIVDKGDIRIILNQLGTATPLSTVTVKTQISGQLIEIGFKEGQFVHKGDFLAQIDPRPFLVTQQQAMGQLAHDQGLLDQARTNLKRYQTLGRQDSISLQQIDDQRFLVQQYTGTVQADQGTLSAANLNLTYCRIVAPEDGVIGLRQVDQGNYVQASDPNGIVVITKLQPISVIFSIPEDNLPEIVRRTRDGAALPVEAWDRANRKLLSAGQLTTLDNQIDTTTGTLKLRATFENADSMLYPNQFVNARLLVNTLTRSVRLPTAAVQRGEPGTFVYAVNPDNTVSVKPVKLGPTDEGFVAVLSGVEPGEKIVTDGTDRLRDGATVIVADAPAGAERRGRGAGGGPPGAR